MPEVAERMMKTMTNNAKAISTFCSHLCVGKDVRPLEPSEWSALAAKMLEIGVAPENLLSFSAQDFIEILGETPESAQRMTRLLERSASLAFEIADYEAKGIHIITRADDEYPKQLKEKLKRSCPPLFYCAGDMSILHRKAVGYVGSRKVSPEDAKFAVDTVSKTVGNQYAVVSGGAKGVDTVSSETAINSGGFAIEYLGDSMIKRMKNSALLEAIQNGQLLLLSFVNPDAGFFAGNLMARNKFIYAQSVGTVIVRSEKKGGTWTGANENLRNGWCASFCWNKPEYDGNQELIRLGCIPIDNAWDGNPEQSEGDGIKKAETVSRPADGGEQLLIPGFE